MEGLLLNEKQKIGVRTQYFLKIGKNWGQNTILPNILTIIISSTTLLFFLITNMKEKVYLD